MKVAISIEKLESQNLLPDEWHSIQKFQTQICSVWNKKLESQIFSLDSKIRNSKFLKSGSILLYIVCK